jgi:hypothetical protein
MPEWDRMVEGFTIDERVGVRRTVDGRWNIVRIFSEPLLSCLLASSFVAFTIHQQSQQSRWHLWHTSAANLFFDRVTCNLQLLPSCCLASFACAIVIIHSIKPPL